MDFLAPPRFFKLPHSFTFSHIPHNMKCLPHRFLLSSPMVWITEWLFKKHLVLMETYNTNWWSCQINARFGFLFSFLRTRSPSPPASVLMPSNKLESRLHLLSFLDSFLIIVWPFSVKLWHLLPRGLSVPFHQSATCLNCNQISNTWA